MAYVAPTLSGYDPDYAPDDGSQTAGNQITLAGVKNNMTDPLASYAAAISTAISSAFSSLLLGQTSTKTGNFSVSSSNDAGKVFSCTNALTVSLPAASAAGDGFNIVVYNNSAGGIIIDGNLSETVNGAATITLDKKYSACFLVCNGTAWYALVVNQILLTQVTLASATTTDLATALTNNVSITGTTTITSFGSAASTGNPIYFISFTAALTLTHNATSLIIPGGANITTAAGDSAIAEYLGSGNWRVRSYTKASGLPIAAGPKGSELRTSGDFTTPATTIASTLFKFTVVGGGAGGGGTNNAAAAAGGGGAGSVAVYYVTGLTASQTCAISYGAAGTAGANTGGTGGNGGNTSITVGATTVTANGGAGGVGSTSNTSVLGGAGGAVSTNGNINMTGIDGQPGIGIASNQMNSGSGGGTPLGVGGKALAAAGAGNAATGYGGGGSGAAGASALGGVGTAGAVLIEWF